MLNKVLFTCEFCEKHFKTENGFLRHHCSKMQRDEDFKSIAGQAAFGYYKDWITLKHHNNSASPDAFKSSALFTSFKNFYNLVQKVKVPSVKIYINLMVRKKIDPRNWCLPETYKIYLEYIQYNIPLNERVAITISTLFACTEEAGVDITQVFDILTANDLIQLLYQQRISPWVLLKSKKFAKFYSNKTSSEEKIVLQAIIKTNYWAKMYKNNPKNTEFVIQCIKEMEI